MGRKKLDGDSKAGDRCSTQTSTEKNESLESGNDNANCLVQEGGVECEVGSDTPGHDEGFYNAKMRVNRDAVLCTFLSMVYLSSTEKRETFPALSFRKWNEELPFGFIDAFSGAGVLGVRILAGLAELEKECDGISQNVDVTFNDLSPQCFKKINANIHRNHTKSGDFQGSINLLQEDAYISLYLGAYDFIHLDPYGGNSEFVLSAFKGIRSSGILTFTSTDIAALFGICSDVAVRNYGGNPRTISGGKLANYSEVAVRLVLASCARAAAICAQAIEPLFCLSAEHFILVSVRSRRGAKAATKSAKSVLPAFLCDSCLQLNYLDGVLIQNCSACGQCFEKGLTRTIGPLWRGPLFDAPFLKYMVEFSQKQQVTSMFSEKFKMLAKMCLHESEIPPSNFFFYSLPILFKSINANPVKVQAIVDELRGVGFAASKTHFDSKAIRTNASIDTVLGVINSLQPKDKTCQG
eukprot:Nk52_evm44s78 gene=Nk52_evmTU44s78